MIYKAYWFTNDGTRNIKPYKGTNKAELIRTTREIAEGNRTERGTSTWRVEDADGRVVAAGGTWINGSRWRAHEEELNNF